MNKTPSKRVTIHDVARRVGVAAMTVSRALNGSARVSDATQRKIREAVEELGYVPNALARGLLTGRTRTIGLLVGDMSNPYWTQVADGAEEVAYNSGFALVLGNIAHQDAKEERLINTLMSNRVDGLLINTSSTKPLDVLTRNRYPFVLIGPEAEGIEADIVRGDVFEGGRGLTRHFLERGHKRIGLLNGPKEDFEAQERERAYRECMADASLSVDPKWVEAGTYLYRGGYEEALKLLRLPKAKRPTAIVASNNFLSLSVIEAARSLGLAIPDDVALAGFDDFALASIIDPFLTVMAQPARRLGAEAMQLLMNRLANPSAWSPARLVYAPELIVRRSSG